MKNPINKSNIRRPLKGILLLIVLYIVSNTFISSVTQFVIVNREINRIGGYYKSIGTIQPFEKEKYLNEAQKIISGDSMINYEDNRRYCLGIIEGLYNPRIKQYESRDLYNDSTDDYRTFLGDSIFTAVVDEVYQAPSAETVYDGLGISITIKERIAGFPDYMKNSLRSAIAVSAKSLRTGDKFDFINNDVIDDLLSLESGKTYLFRTYRDDIISKSFTMIKPLYTDGPLYEKLDDDGYIDWENPKWRMLKEDIDVLNENIQSYFITATKDMTAVPIFQESMKDYYLKEGRLLNREDDINQNYVCVIHEDFSKIRNINIGDKLEIQMRNTEKGHSYLASSKDRRDWKTYNTSEPITFEVVGIMASFLNARGTIYGRDIYIPDSTLPEGFGYYYNQGIYEPDVDSYDYSFTLRSSEEQSEFIKKYEEQLKEMGYKLYFIENNAESYWNSAKPLKHSALISFVLFTVLLLLTQYFVAYIYVDGHKLNYAIERALGIPTKVSGTHLVAPLILFGGMTSIIGGFLGYDNAIDKSEELLTNLAEVSQFTATSALDIKYFILFIIGLMTLFIIILFIKTSQLKKTSIIDLINSHGTKKKNKQKKNIKEKEDDTEVDFKTLNSSFYLSELDYNRKNLLMKGSRDTLRRYFVNHSLRSKDSSMLLIMLAGIFVFSLLWMNYLIIRNNAFIDETYNETLVTGDVITNYDETVSGTKRGPISGTHIDNLLETGLVKDYTAVANMSYSDMYIERNGIEEKYEMKEEDKKAYHIPTPSFEVIASNKPYNSETKNNLTDVHLAEGYTLEDFYKSYRTDYSDRTNPVIVDEEGNKETPILASKKAMKDYELEIGDRIALVEEYRGTLKIYGTIVGTFADLDMSQVHEWLEYYTYAGKDEQDLFIYPLSALEAIERNRVYYRRLSFKFNPETNRELLARKDELKNMVSNNIYDDHRNELKLWDEELVNVADPLEKNLSLLQVLYPITFVVSILIAGILAFMMVLRRTLDVAILRVLGVKEKEIRKSLFIENIILTLIGISIATAIMAIIKSGSYSVSLLKYAMIIGGYLLGTIVGLVLSIAKVTNKKTT